MKMWTLRSGNIPVESSSGEISMLKDCLEEELTMGIGMFLYSLITACRAIYIAI